MQYARMVRHGKALSRTDPKILVGTTGISLPPQLGTPCCGFQMRQQIQPQQGPFRSTPGMAQLPACCSRGSTWIAIEEPGALMRMAT